MKYNEKLVNDLEKIPDRFLDELNQTNVKKKKIKWTVPVSVAACAAAVIAVPVILSRLSHQNYNSFDPASTVSTILTEAVAVTDEPDNITSVTVTETIPETSVPEVTEPDTPEDMSSLTVLKYYECNPKNLKDNNGCIYDPEEAYYAVNFLKDKEFEAQINSDIAGLIDSIPTDFECPDSADEAFYYRITKQSDDPDKRDLFIIQNVQNGYYSLMVGVRVNNYNDGTVSLEYVRSLMYDLVEKRKIESVNEYFGGGESAEELIQLYREKTAGKYGDISGFTNDYLIFSDSDGKSYIINLHIELALEKNLLFVRPRDFSEVLDEGFYTESHEINLSAFEE